MVAIMHGYIFKLMQRYFFRFSGDCFHIFHDTLHSETISADMQLSEFIFDLSGFRTLHDLLQSYSYVDMYLWVSEYTQTEREEMHCRLAAGNRQCMQQTPLVSGVSDRQKSTF
jgi:hypothetical protein